jgi:hypothetical protein
MLSEMLTMTAFLNIFKVQSRSSSLTNLNSVPPEYEAEIIIAQPRYFSNEV